MRFVVTLVIACLLGGSANAGPALDDVLNYMYMDQSVPMKGPQELFDVHRTIQLTKDAPIGQTFVTGPETREIVRIRVFLAPNRDWQPGEGAELVLWDSPEKKLPLGRYTIWHAYRGFHFSQAEWEIRTRVEPDTCYYFEISYAGRGDGKLSRIGVMNGDDAYKPGQGHLAGEASDFDLCFQVHSKRAPDRVGNFKKTFARFDLDKPELAEIRQAVEGEDFDAAIAKTVAYFETAHKDKFATGNEAPVLNPDCDTTVADQEMQNYFTSQEGITGYAGPEVNWRGQWAYDDKGHPIASYNAINNFGARGVLANAYLATGNIKYMRKLNALSLDWYTDNPPPGESRIGGCPWDPVWNSLATGLRLGQLPVLYSRMYSSPDFTTECRMAFLLDLADHADTLVLKGGDASGNWAFTQNTSLLNFGVEFPEFRNAGIWRETAMERLATGLAEDYLPDGVEKESAPGYQRMAYKPLARGIYDKLIRSGRLNAPFGENLGGLLEKQAEYFMYMAMPDGVSPHLGDWGHEQTRSYIQEDAERFNRSDMLYVATAGKQGAKPKDLSKLYPYAGIVTLRSDWGDVGRPYEDARYLMLHGLHFGPHGHSDVNGITLYAYGRELLVDPGSHVYGAPEHAHLTTAEVHNLMTIDGEDQDKTGKTAFKGWATTPAVDYLSSWGQVYKAGGYNREVIYVRSNGDSGVQDYWVVRDTAEGEGTHLLEQRWHFPLDSGAGLEKSSLVSRTGFAEKGNLAILPVDPSRVKADMTTTDTWLDHGKNLSPRKLPTAVYSATAALPAALDTLLVPCDGPHGPSISLESLQASSNGLDAEFKVTQGKAEDLFIFRNPQSDIPNNPKSAIRNPKSGISFDGERLFVRRIGGKLRSALIVNGSSLTVDGKQILKCARPISWIVVSVEGPEFKVYTSSSEPTLRVSAGGGKVVVKSTDSDRLLRPASSGSDSPLLIRDSGKK